MPQQINLYIPILLRPHRHFSARAMVQAFAALVVGIAVLCAWIAIQNLALRRELDATAAQHGRERQSLLGAIAAQPAAGGNLASLEQGLQSMQRGLAERRQTMAELMRGRIVDGRGPSARLRLIAQTVPDDTWLEEIVSGSGRLSLRGRTLDPASLKPWIARLDHEPLLAGQALSTLQVEQEAPGWRFVIVRTGSGP
jgi:Tfp pilus assembly protein PilN